MNPKTPTYLDYLGSLVIRVSLFDHLRATSEYVCEEAPMRLTTQEVFTHRNESGETGNGIGCEVVELNPEEVQKPPKEKMRWQRKSTIDMSR